MGKLLHSIGRIFQGGAKSFSRFPAAMASALAVAAAASILIQIDNSRTERLLTNLQIAFAFGALLGMALAVAGLRLSSRSWMSALSNLLTVLISGGLFYYLQLQGNDIPEIIVARISAAAVICFLVFLLVISHDPGRSDYNQASFMVLKSALIALIYALVIMLGLFFIAFTVRTLLYKEMSDKVYQHIAVWSALGWFAFFLGYFPSFRKDKEDEHLETAQKHPAFIEILFNYVLIPIMTVLTAVLLIWAIQILVVRKWPAFNQLAGIFAAYTAFGIFLSIMVSHYTQAIAFWFRRIFPFASLLFLAFEAYAIISQINQIGILTGEYFFILVWIYALLGSIVLMIQHISRYRLIAFLTITLVVAAILPVVGFQDLPVASQAGRLMQVLNRNDMLVDGAIKTAPSSISKDDKILITETVDFLLQYEDVPKARWFDDSIQSYSDFNKVFGFAQTYDYYTDGQNTVNIYLMLPTGYADISDYQFAVNSNEIASEQPQTVQGQKGVYVITCRGMHYDSAAPAIEVTRDGKTVLDQDLSAWRQQLVEKYSDSGNKLVADYEDLTLELVGDGVRIMVIFNNAEIVIDQTGGVVNSSFGINSIYLGE